MHLIEKIKNAGIVGAGGAGFPTHIKLNCKVDYLIINGMECEPLLQSDKYLMRNKSDEIIKGCEEVAKSIKAKEIYIGVKEEYFDEIDALRNSIEKLNSKVKLHLSKAFYPAGDEQVLVYETIGKVVPPGGIPLNVGAVVSNVGTVFNIYESINDNPVIYKYVTVIGEVKNPSIIKVPIGTSVKECIYFCGGPETEDFAVIMGGPMMGKKISKDKTEERVITKTDNAVMVLPHDHYLIAREKAKINHLENQAKSACIQCHYCSDMCPRNLLGHPLNPHKIMRAIALGEFNNDVFNEALICCECGVCEMYACPMGLSPMRINVYLKGILKERGTKWSNNRSVFEPNELRDYRKVPTFRLIERLHLGKYLNQHIDEGQELNPQIVKIPLKQHIGVPAKSVVAVGDEVEKGQIIGIVDEGKMGSDIHASISGKIAEIGDKVVIDHKG